MMCFSYGAKAPTENEDLVRQQIERAHRYRNILVEIGREYVETIRAAPVEQRTVVKAAARERRNARTREERGRCGLHSGTYLLVEEAAQKAVDACLRPQPGRPQAEPRIRPWLGEGSVGIQVTGGGITTEALLGADDLRAQIVGEGKHRSLRIRIWPAGREQVWATFPIIYHRDLPSDVMVKWVRVHRRRVATHFKWQVDIVVDHDAVAAAPALGTVALDLGWRKMDDGMRVAKWVDDADRDGELRLPERLLLRLAKTEDLASIRKKNFNAALAELLLHRERFPEWMRETTVAAHSWKSCDRLASLVTRWRSSRWDGDEELFHAAEAWRKQDKHLYEWEANQRLNVLRARREVYRLFAVQMAGWRRVVIEKLDLRKFAGLPEAGEQEEYSITNARGRRHFACLSELRSCLEHAVAKAGGVLEEHASAWTTATCSWCGHLNEWEKPELLRQVCGGCGLSWDQDVNAARNLLREAQSGAAPVPRSKKANANIPEGMSPAEYRRLVALETRRKNRSKEEPEDPKKKGTKK